MVRREKSRALPCCIAYRDAGPVLGSIVLEKSYINVSLLIDCRNCGVPCKVNVYIYTSKSFVLSLLLLLINVIFLLSLISLLIN